MRGQIWNAVAVLLSGVVASIVVAFLPPGNSEAVEFLIWLVFFGASLWILNRVSPLDFPRPPKG